MNVVRCLFSGIEPQFNYVRACVHVKEQGARIVAKWKTDNQDVVLCHVCDNKVQDGNQTPLVLAS